MSFGSNLRRTTKKKIFFVVKPVNRKLTNLVTEELKISKYQIFTDYEVAIKFIADFSDSIELVVCDQGLLAQEESLIKVVKEKLLPIAVFKEDSQRAIREAFLMAYYENHKRGHKK